VSRVGGEWGEALLLREQRTSAGSLASLGLTPRRTEVLAALMEGETNQQIAQRLDLSPRTVQNHIAHIFDVLGARTRTEAAALARQVLDAD
jgi:DNA-binding NarL/FixJ family response regulator